MKTHFWGMFEFRRRKRFQIGKLNMQLYALYICIYIHKSVVSFSKLIYCLFFFLNIKRKWVCNGGCFKICSSSTDKSLHTNTCFSLKKTYPVFAHLDGVFPLEEGGGGGGGEKRRGRRVGEKEGGAAEGGGELPPQVQCNALFYIRCSRNLYKCVQLSSFSQ